MIVDCFTFYNETELLKKRIQYLSSVVDKFVVVESTITHGGHKKELYFDESHFDMSKIIRVVVEDNPEDSNPWSRENHQRNCITRGLEKLELKDDDVIMVSDVDEIPKREVISNMNNILKTNPIVSLHMLAFCYSFDFMQIHEPWFGTVVTTRKHTMTPQYMRNNRWHFPKITNAGWHLSSFGDFEFIINKMRNFAHCDDQKLKDTTQESMKEFIERGCAADGSVQHIKTPQEVKVSIPIELG